MTTTAQDAIDKIRRLINDETASAVSGNRWSDAELLEYISEAQRAVVELKPEANPVTEVFDVDASNARQRLSAALAYQIIRVERNV